jgi:hypothetical protein
MRQKTCALILAGLILAGCQARENLPAACAQKPDSGMCRAAFNRYYYDAGTGQCRAFIWGGCGGSVPFESLEECQNTCNAEAADMPAPEVTGNDSLSF